MLQSDPKESRPRDQLLSDSRARLGAPVTLEDFALVARVAAHDGCDAAPESVRVELYELARCRGCGKVLGMKRTHFPALPPVPRVEL
jgi:hypothetical protein